CEFYSCKRLCVSSKSASIAGSDLPNRLMTIVATKLKINPGRSSYKSKMPPERKSPQTITVTAPIIIPTKEPFLVTPFQNKDKRIIGPKEAPNPAQAYPTRSKTVLSGLVPIGAAHNAITILAIQAGHTNALFVEFLHKNPVSNSSATADEETSDCESIVVIMAQRIAARRIPATIGLNNI